MQPRPYQADIKDDVNRVWDDGGEELKNVLAVLPTGAGKTFVFSLVIKEHDGVALAIAHRQELVSQISCSLASFGVIHNIIAPLPVIRLITAKHMRLFGRSFYSPNSNKAVAGVDTLRARSEAMEPWLRTVTLWVTDECHHLTKKNKWGTAVDLLPYARGLGVTATPLRADGLGLGRWNDSVFDEMVVGPSMRDIIEDGYLTDYRIRSIPNDLNLENVTVSPKTGDYIKPQLSKEVAKSHIVGDIVETYLEHADGLLGITFVTDVETGTRVAKEFNEAGVRAECVSHHTDDKTRDEILRRFERREIMQLVNVDLFGEGFDLPAVQVVSFARPTASYSLFVQQFGRGLRLLLPADADMSTRESRLAAIAGSIKPHALILDHVGNVLRHGLPDARTSWTLEAREKRRRKAVEDDMTPVRICTECTGVYERVTTVCPYCSHEWVPAHRGSPEQVDGELMELDAHALAVLRAAVNSVDLTAEECRADLLERDCPRAYVDKNVRSHLNRQRVQAPLRAIMDHYLDLYPTPGEAQKRFYWRYGIDIMSAKALNPSDALELSERIAMDL
jgi:superfamily II DNA or RNA helicase